MPNLLRRHAGKGKRRQLILPKKSTLVSTLSAAPPLNSHKEKNFIDVMLNFRMVVLVAVIHGRQLLRGHVVPAFLSHLADRRKAW
ncbi:MAG: hypothetical protein WA715_15405 [Candidatus Acidiferrum sp.]